MAFECQEQFFLISFTTFECSVQKSLSIVRTVHSSIRTLRQKLDFFNFSSLCTLESCTDAQRCSNHKNLLFFSVFKKLFLCFSSVRMPSVIFWIFFSAFERSIYFSLLWLFWPLSSRTILKPLESNYRDAR